MRKVEECKKCKGKGYITIRNKNITSNNWLRYRREICSFCDGKGIITSEIVP